MRGTTDIARDPSYEPSPDRPGEAAADPVTGRTTGPPADDSGAPPPPGRRRRRTALVAGGITLVLVVAVLGALGLGGGDASDRSAPGRSGTTVSVTRDTLVDRTTVDGQLGYGTEIPLPIRATGTVTWLPERGTTVRRGEPLLRVDDRPVVLMYGTLPMYRELGARTGGPADGATARPSGAPAAGATDSPKAGGSSAAPTAPATPATAAADTARPPRGADVMQFETNLAALGHTGFTVDEEYTAQTAAAVKRWQRSLGLPETGVVGISDVVYASGPVRIGHASVRPGQEASAGALAYTGTTRKVVVNAAANDSAWAVRGNEVTITLPDGRTVEGEIASVDQREPSASDGPGAAPGEGGGNERATTFPVTITIADQRGLGPLENSPVTVRYVRQEREDVLTVPVSALVALAEGGHGLELADGPGDGDGAGAGGEGDGGGGTGRFVPVRTGLFADGKVEVSGPEVRVGRRVWIPA
jgi:peptidoglycan hydrolase-like protein with peptidoglycan-binding domain